MTSAITPNTIDATYPVAGQDNDSQGFRDNFTNIKTNFTVAASEMSDLQSKVILKSPLNGSTTISNDFAGQQIINAELVAATLNWVDLGTVADGSTVTVDYSQGHYQTVIANGSLSISFSNFPSPTTSGAAFVIVRITTVTTNQLVTLDAGVASSGSAAGVQGWNGSGIVFANAGSYEFEFRTIDGGTNIFITDLNRPTSSFTNPIISTNATNSTSTTTGSLITAGGIGAAGSIYSGGTLAGAKTLIVSGAQSLATATAVDLTTIASYFTTAASSTATLANGVNGQIKTFAAVNVSSGNMVITVATAGWKSSGSGTITFTSIGQGCTLQFINGKWYGIGNNGCTFG